MQWQRALIFFPHFFSFFFFFSIINFSVFPILFFIETCTHTWMASTSNLISAHGINGKCNEEWMLNCCVHVCEPEQCACSYVEGAGDFSFFCKTNGKHVQWKIPHFGPFYILSSSNRCRSHLNHCNLEQRISIRTHFARSCAFDSGLNWKRCTRVELKYTHVNEQSFWNAAKVFIAIFECDSDYYIFWPHALRDPRTEIISSITSDHIVTHCSLCNGLDFLYTYANVCVHNVINTLHTFHKKFWWKI